MKYCRGRNKDLNKSGQVAEHTQLCVVIMVEGDAIRFSTRFTVYIIYHAQRTNVNCDVATKHL